MLTVAENALLARLSGLGRIPLAISRVAGLNPSEDFDISSWAKYLAALNYYLYFVRLKAC